MGSNTEKKPWTNLQNLYKNWSKEIKSDNFCYRKVGRAITKWGAIEKSPILLSQYSWRIMRNAEQFGREVSDQVLNMYSGELLEDYEKCWTIWQRRFRSGIFSWSIYWLIYDFLVKGGGNCGEIWNNG